MAAARVVKMRNATNSTKGIVTAMLQMLWSILWLINM